MDDLRIYFRVTVLAYFVDVKLNTFDSMYEKVYDQRTY